MTGATVETRACVPLLARGITSLTERKEERGKEEEERNKGEKSQVCIELVT